MLKEIHCILNLGELAVILVFFFTWMININHLETSLDFLFALRINTTHKRRKHQVHNTNDNCQTR